MGLKSSLALVAPDGSALRSGRPQSCWTASAPNPCLLLPGGQARGFPVRASGRHSQEREALLKWSALGELVWLFFLCSPLGVVPLSVLGL